MAGKAAFAGKPVQDILFILPSGEKPPIYPSFEPFSVVVPKLSCIFHQAGLGKSICKLFLSGSVALQNPVRRHELLPS